MVKRFFVLMVLVLFLASVPGILADEVNVDVNKTSYNEIIIQNTEKPAIFSIKITNTGKEDDFEFWSYTATKLIPKHTIHLKKGESKNVILEFYGLQKQIEKGNLAFNYYIKRMSTKQSQKQKLVVKIIKLKDAFEIQSEQISPTDNMIDITIKNNINYKFENLNAEMSSDFFDVNKSFSLGPYEEKNLTITLNKEGFNNLLAGFYTLDTEIKFNNTNASYETPINFVEKEIVETFEEDKGFFIDRDTVKKTNKGNSIAGISISIQKNIISRLFTTFSEYPDNINREEGKVIFIWNKELEPGKSYEVETRTNWFYPLIIVLLIVGIVYLVKRLTIKDVDLRKKIYFVRIKGGEFGLKVSIMVNSNKYVENVKIRDKLPALAKIHERFGGERPSNIDQKNKKIEWEFDKLQVGERRMISYIMYSKIGVLGRFALPSATAFYQKQGVTHESHSNRAYFVAEQAKKFQ